MMLQHQINANSRRTNVAVLVGVAIGILVALPAIFISVDSGGAGHGHYVAARALFPLAMLLTRVEGSIGVLSVSAALLQFPLYGAVLGWSTSRAQYGVAILLAVLHLALAIICFAGTLPDFS